MSEGPMNKHQHMARGQGPYTSAEKGGGGGTGGLRNNDAHVPEAGEGHVHETEPSKDAEHHHKEHGHRKMHEDRDHHHGGHKHMQEHFPKDHHGGHKNKSNY